MDERLERLRETLLDCISYVGSANDQEREQHAEVVCNKAFDDYAAGKTPKWFWPDE